MNCWLLFILFATSTSATVINIDFSTRGLLFEGIGSISGGGAVARMLPEYPEPQRSEILDYLFKPNFGASLHLLKVEVGGDDDTTQGVESSHRHYQWETGNFNRGYEWWLMKEAKKRNPKINLYGLPWAWPGWLGNGSHFIPFANMNETVNYIVGWILGAKAIHGLNIDLIGIWNEKPPYVPYIKALYNELVRKGIANLTRIVASDDWWEIVDHINNDPDLDKMVAKIATHYPGSQSPKKAKRLGKSLCSSEDDSTDARTTKAGCIARILNRNYVEGLFTSTYIFNIISAFYDDLDYPRTGLLTANQPWGGWYNVDDPVWITAHTTQFTQPGWYYLSHDKGVGFIGEKSGSYVSLISPDKNFFSIIIETIDHFHSPCVRPPIAQYPKFITQNVTFVLKNWKFPTPPKLYQRVSDLTSGEMFKLANPIQVSQDFSFTILISANQIITLSTIGPGKKGAFEDGIDYRKSLPMRLFPFPYGDDFESTEIDQEGRYIMQQIGVFEVQKVKDSKHNHVLQQMLLQAPVTWCAIPNIRPMAVFGDYNWTDISFSSDIMLPLINSTSAAYIGARINHGGCTTFTTSGIFVWASPRDGAVYVKERLLSLRPTCESVFLFKDKFSWFNLKMSVIGNRVSVLVDNKIVIKDCQLKSTGKLSANGFLGIGTLDYQFAMFDNIEVANAMDEKLYDSIENA